MGETHFRRRRPPIAPARSSSKIVSAFHARRVALGLTNADISHRAGVGEQTITRWNRRSPTLANFEACLETVGLELVVHPIGGDDA